MDRPHALLITWSTYGTWLPGDPRGYVSRTAKPDRSIEPRQNEFGTAYSKDHAYARTLAEGHQQYPTVWLSPDEALVVAKKLIEAVTERGWFILQAAIMANHVHVVLTQCLVKAEAARRVLKGVTQAALSKHAGKSRKWWTAGGSDRNKWGDEAIEDAVNYVRGQEGMLVGIENMCIYPK